MERSWLALQDVLGRRMTEDAIDGHGTTHRRVTGRAVTF